MGLELGDEPAVVPHGPAAEGLFGDGGIVEGEEEGGLPVFEFGADGGGAVVFVCCVYVLVCLV